MSPNVPREPADVTLRQLRLGRLTRIAADMDGYQGLPTSYSIRAYLAVLYRL